MNNELKIEKGIPIPSGYLKTEYRIELLKTLEVGDSILMAEHPSEVRQMYFNPAKRLGMHIIVRKTADGTRMWRDK